MQGEDLAEDRDSDGELGSSISFAHDALDPSDHALEERVVAGVKCEAGIDVGGAEVCKICFNCTWLYASSTELSDPFEY